MQKLLGIIQSNSIFMQVSLGIALFILCSTALTSHSNIFIIRIPATSFNGSSLIYSVSSSLLRIFLANTLSILFGILTAAIIFFLKLPPNGLVRIMLLLSITPPLIWCIGATMITGLSFWNPFLVILLSTMFLLTALLIFRFSDIQLSILELIKTHRVSKWFQFKHILINENLPFIVIITRISFFLGWIPLLSAESLGIQHGLGSILILGRQIHSWPIVLSTWGMVVSLSLMVDCILQQFFSWFLINEETSQ